MAKDSADREAFKWIYLNREYFKTLDFPHSDISGWLLYATNQTLIDLGMPVEMNENVLYNFNLALEAARKVNNTEEFDFFQLFFADNLHKSYEEWVFSLDWMRAIPLQWLKRNWFVEELFW